MASSTCALPNCDQPAEGDRELCASHEAVMQRLNDRTVVIKLQHELDLIDVIINHDMGAAGDLVLGRHSVPALATWWTSFLVTNRSVEQAFKFIAPIDEPRNIGHRLQSKWADAINKKPNTPEYDMLGSLREGYRYWRALFQSRWSDLDALLSHVEKHSNAKEYVLIDPDRNGARIDLLLPLALADIATMSWGAVWTMIKPGFNFNEFGIRFGDTTPGKLSQKICKDRIKHVLKYRDIPSNDIISKEGSARYCYEPQAIDALMTFFDGDAGLANAHADVADVLANTRDWRLQFFIKTSECQPLQTINGVLTDATGGRWHPTVFRGFS